MGPDDELDDERSSGPLLPPADRLWRHPSELAAAYAARPLRAAERRMWTVAVLAGLVGAVLATGTTFATGALRTRKVAVPALEQELMAPVVTLAALGASSVAASVADVRPSCVALIARDAHGIRTSAGVVFRSDGMVLTAAHMVTGAQALEAIVAGTRKVAAHVVASDAATDLAVVKLDGSGYTPAPLGTALNVRVGDQVLAVSPNDGTTDEGLVAGVGKSSTEAGTALDGLLEITTARTPATIGAPVLNRDGAVIAVTTANDKGSGEFATPMDWARQVVAQLLSTGHVTPVWLGVLGHDLSAADAAALSVAGGAVVDKVYAASPAADAGVKVGDEILGVDGRAVVSMATLIMTVHSRAQDTDVELDVRRGATTWKMRARLMPRPTDIA
ncbi:MAG: S1C family serine protease [Acidimicrobiales bacterium]